MKTANVWFEGCAQATPALFVPKSPGGWPDFYLVLVPAFARTLRSGCFITLNLEDHDTYARRIGGQAAWPVRLRYGSPERLDVKWGALDVTDREPGPTEDQIIKMVKAANPEVRTWMADVLNDCPPKFAQIRDQVGLPDGFTLLLERDKADGGGRWYFQVEAVRRDICTGQMGRGRGGKAYLSEYATVSELVQTAFGLYKSFLEHEARETFTWNGRRVFGPHMDVRALWEVAERFDARPGPTSLPEKEAS